MRNLWILFSALLIGLAVALCVASPIDPLLWTAGVALGPALIDVQMAQPIARFADAALIGAAAGYLLIFLPLSAATWIGGGRQARMIRTALRAARSDAPIEPLPVDTATPWWPLLAPYAAQADAAAGAISESSVVPPARSGRAAAIDGLVTHQSGAAVFGDFPIIALGLGVIALTGQLLPVLAADPGAIAGAARTALGAALARGFCSLVAATAVAALFGLMSRFVAAILRRRAEALLGALDLAGRGWGDGLDEPRTLTVTPLPQSPRSGRIDVDDDLVEHVAQRIWQAPGAPGRDVAESVDNAIREMHATTLRPMLHDISRLLSLLGERATHLITTVDDRLGQQAEHTRQLLAATHQISRALAERPGPAGSGVAGPAPADRAQIERAPADRAPVDPVPVDPRAVDELRQALRDERAAAVALLRSAGEEAAGQLDTSLRAAAQSIGKPLTAQADAVRKAIERMDATAEAVARTGSAIERSTGGIEQQLERLASAQEALKGLPAPSGATGDVSALVQPLEAQAEAVRKVVERIDAAAEAMARTGSIVVQSTGAIEQKLDWLAESPAPMTGKPSRPIVAADDIAALMAPFAAQAEAVRKVAERIDAAAETMARTGSAIEQTTGAIEQQLGRLAGAQEALKDMPPSGTTAEDIAALAQPLWAQTDAVRQVVERMDAAAEAMARTGGAIEQSTGAIEQKLDRLAGAQEALQSSAGSGAAAEDIAALAKAAREALESLAAVSDQLKQASAPLAAARDRILAAPESSGSGLGSGGWARRVGALHRASVDLTSDLPVLDEPGAEDAAEGKPPLRNEGTR